MRPSSTSSPEGCSLIWSTMSRGLNFLRRWRWSLLTVLIEQQMFYQLSQIVSWNSRLYPRDVMDMGPECLVQREKFFRRLFLLRPDSLDVSDLLHKIEVHTKTTVSLPICMHLTFWFKEIANSASELLSLQIPSVRCPSQLWHLSFSPLYDVLNLTTHTFSESFWHVLFTDTPVITMTKTHAKTKTKTMTKMTKRPKGSPF